MKGRDAELLLESIDESFGLTKHDFEDVDGYKKPIYMKWGEGANVIDIADLKHYSLKISKNLGDIYIDSIKTDGWLIVGKGTRLHCKDINAGMGYVDNFEGYLI